MSNDCGGGLDGRCRNLDGEIRRKRGDTQIGTLRQEYGLGLAPGYRSDTHLQTPLRQEGFASLSDYLKNRG